MDKRQFRASWGPGYAHQETQVITMADITEDRGWFSENIENLEAAAVGEMVNCSCISGELFVTRLE